MLRRMRDVRMMKRKVLQISSFCPILLLPLFAPRTLCHVLLVALCLTVTHKPASVVFRGSLVVATPHHSTMQDHPAKL